jgi:hypothetical protein
MSYAIVKPLVYALILANTTASQDVKEYIRLEMLHTDSFHTDTFHDVMESDDPTETLAIAYEEVRDLILAYFAEPLNFAPGIALSYLTLTIVEGDDVLESTYMDIYTQLKATV